MSLMSAYIGSYIHFENFGNMSEYYRVFEKDDMSIFIEGIFDNVYFLDTSQWKW